MTEEQAKEWEEFELRRQNRDLIIDSVGGAGYPPGVISYNNFWYERGENTVADRRTSLIYDPPNGRTPPTNAAGRERRQVSRPARSRCSAERGVEEIAGRVRRMPFGNAAASRPLRSRDKAQGSCPTDVMATSCPAISALEGETRGRDRSAAGLEGVGMCWPSLNRRSRTGRTPHGEPG